MGTTLVIVELLVIGFQVLVWVCLLAWHSWDSFDKCLGHVQNQKELLAVGGTAAAYTLGLAFDRFAGLCIDVLRSWGVLKKASQRLAHVKATTWLTEFASYVLQRIVKPDPSDTDGKDLRGNLMKFRKDGKTEVVQFVEGLHRQKRLLRATFFNAIIIALTLSFTRDCCGLLAFLLLLTGIGAFMAWWKLEGDIAKGWQGL